MSLGDEFYVDLGSELSHPGLVDLVSTATNQPVGVAPVIYAGTSLTINMPSALIGSPTSLRYGVLVGDFLSSTDRAPNGTTGILESTAVVPAPPTLLLGLVGAGCAGVARLRRRGR